MRATVAAVRADRMVVSLPAGIHARSPAGRFFLGRASEAGPLDRSWTPYLRRVLRPVRVEARGDSFLWTLAPDPDPADDAACTWLRGLSPGDSIDLLGPYGNGFEPPANALTLLLVADSVRAPFLYPLIDPVLDRGGRVTLLLHAASASQSGSGQDVRDSAIVRDLPLAVEVRQVQAEEMLATVVHLSRWADSLFIALAADALALPSLAHSMRAVRFRLDAGYAQVLADVPLPCGVGACLACLVGLAGGGFTRACVHGPIFDLTRLG